MILIADSGSTKTDWCVVEKGELVQQIFTKGTNPFFQSEEEISNEIATALLPELKTNEFEAVAISLLISSSDWKKGLVPLVKIC